jgi:hypothetical protein
MRHSLALAAAALVLTFGTARAFISPGTIAPDFTKHQLVDGAVGPTWNLYSHAPDVVILFVLGYF